MGEPVPRSIQGPVFTVNGRVGGAFGGFCGAEEFVIRIVAVAPGGSRESLPSLFPCGDAPGWVVAVGVAGEGGGC